jgi:PAS domain S-box-containing protein
MVVDPSTMSVTPRGGKDENPGGNTGSASALRSAQPTLSLQVLEHAPLAVALVQGPEHRYVFANNAYRALSALDTPLVGRMLREVFPYATDRSTAFIDTVYATCQPVRLRRQTIRAIPGRNSSVWNVDLLPVRNEGGRIDGVLLVLDDVSDVASRPGQATAEEAAEAEAAAQRIVEGVMRHMPACLAASAEGDVRVCSNRKLLARQGGDQPGNAATEREAWHFRRRDGTIAAADELPLARAIATGALVSIEELVLERPDGERFHILCNAGPIRDDAGNIHGGVVVCHDVSALRRVEDALRATEDSLQLALESADMGSWDLDLVSDRARRSLRHDQIFGYSEPLAEWGRETFMGHVVPDDRPAVATAFDAAISEGVLDFECRICRADGGEVRWVVGRGRTYYDDAGLPVRIAGIVQDITERKLADLVLREAKDKVEQLQKAAQDEILERYERMTPRQRDVLCLVVAGHPNKEIAYRLGISERTVEVHRGWAMQKMKARSIPDLVRMAALIGVQPGAAEPEP